MDAGVIIPYNLLKVYGDKRIVEYMYPGIKRFMEFQADASTDFIRPPGGNNWGDHLAVGEETSKGFVAASHYGFDAKLMIELAKALGKEEDVVKYKKLFQNIKEAFAKKYILDNGNTTEDTQTTYALALYFDLYPEELAAKGAARLAQKIKENGDKFTTGFHGTKYVMLVLAQYGYHDLSYRLFKQTEYPSWGFSVVNGSTSIWERWNSYTDDEEQNDLFNRQMNSFSHYAFGSVAEWMFMYALGIDSEDDGYRNIIIKPSISREMDFMHGSYKSINGTIKSAWAWMGKSIEYSITIPTNTKAKIYLPSDDPSRIKQGNKPLSKQEGIEIIESTTSETIVGVGSGTYTFSVKM
jgi:alpha-L-rhamnosidase